MQLSYNLTCEAFKARGRDFDGTLISVSCNGPLWLRQHKLYRGRQMMSDGGVVLSARELKWGRDPDISDACQCRGEAWQRGGHKRRHGTWRFQLGKPSWAAELDNLIYFWTLVNAVFRYLADQLALPRAVISLEPSAVCQLCVKNSFFFCDAVYCKSQEWRFGRKWRSC